MTCVADSKFLTLFLNRDHALSYNDIHSRLLLEIPL